MNLSTLRFVAYSLPPSIVGLMWCITHYYNFGLAIVAGAIILSISIATMFHLFRKARLEYINSYIFPSGVIKKFMVEHSELNLESVNKVELALKQFFMIFALSKDGGQKPRGGFLMPSRLADDLWHHFMLESKEYEKFCKMAFGGMFHHKPGNESDGNKNLYYMKSFPKELTNTYEYANKLKDYGMYVSLSSIPVLFAVDSYFKVDKGYYYDTSVMNNIDTAIKNAAYSSNASSDSGSVASCGGFASCSGGCSGSCSGSCGGGCGGGGD